MGVKKKPQVTRGVGNSTRVDGAAGLHKTKRPDLKLVLLQPDGTFMRLHRFIDVDPLELDPITKYGRGLCSQSYCEDSAAFWTVRSGRKWAFCFSHAQTFAAGQTYWTPGLPWPDAEDLPG